MSQKRVAAGTTRVTADGSTAKGGTFDTQVKGVSAQNLTAAPEAPLSWNVLREYIGDAMRRAPLTEDEASELRRSGDEPESKIADAWLAANNQAVAAQALRDFANSLDLNAIAQEWAGPDSSGEWSAANAAAQVQIAAFDQAARIQAGRE